MENKSPIESRRRFYVAKDGEFTSEFLYLFSDILDICGVAAREDAPNLDAPLLLCTFRKDQSEIEENTFYAEDLFYLADQKAITSYIGDRRLIFFGSGNTAISVLEKYDVCPKYLLDNDQKKDGTMSCGLKVYSPDALLKENKKSTFVLVCSIYYADIKEQLLTMGWEEYINFAPYDYFCAEEMIRKVLSAEPKWNWICQKALKTIRLDPEGGISLCCEMEKGAGNLLGQDYDSIVASVRNKCLRLSILNGSYCFCNQVICPLLRHNMQNDLKDMDRVSLIEDSFRICSVESSYDKNCNLHCTSCRENVFWEENKKLDILTDKMITQILPTIEELFLSGNGEVFASPYCKKIIDSDQFTKIKALKLLTNGNILQENLWNRMIQTLNGKIKVTFSIDAATPETYRKIRRGGTLEKVERHLAYCKKLRHAGKLELFRITFVMQKDNYKEIVRFAEMGKRYGVDIVNFTYIRNWGTYSMEEFRDICMYDIVDGMIVPDDALQDEIRKVEDFDFVVVDASL